MPPLLSLLGLGSAAAGTWLGWFRWPLLGAAILLNAVGFCLAYRSVPSPRNKLVAWASAALTTWALAYGFLT